MSISRPRTDIGTTFSRRQGLDSAAVFVFALHDLSGQELIRLGAIRVVAEVPVFHIWARWGDKTDTCMLEIPLSTGSPLSELREQALIELSSPRILQSTTTTNCQSTIGLGHIDVRAVCDDCSVDRPHTSSQSRRASTPLDQQKRPHTSAGLAAVPAERLQDLHFTAGGTRISDGNRRAPRVNRSALVSTSTKFQSQGWQKPGRPRSVASQITKQSSTELVPHEDEASLPAAAICSRGYALLLPRPNAEHVRGSKHAEVCAEGHSIHAV